MGGLEDFSKINKQKGGDYYMVLKGTHHKKQTSFLQSDLDEFEVYSPTRSSELFKRIL